MVWRDDTELERVFDLDFMVLPKCCNMDFLKHISVFIWHMLQMTANNKYSEIFAMLATLQNCTLGISML